MVPWLTFQYVEVLYSAVPFVVGISKALFSRIDSTALANVNVIVLHHNNALRSVKISDPFPKLPSALEKLFRSMKRVLVERPRIGRSQLASLENKRFEDWVSQTKEDFLTLRVLILRTLCELLKYAPMCFKYSEVDAIESVFNVDKFLKLSLMDFPDARQFYTELTNTQHFGEWVMKSYHYLTPENPHRQGCAVTDAAIFMEDLLNCYSANTPVVLNKKMQNLRDEIYAGDFSLIEFNKKNKRQMDNVLNISTPANTNMDLTSEYILYRYYSSRASLSSPNNQIDRLSLPDSPVNILNSQKLRHQSFFSKPSPQTLRQQTKWLYLANCPDSDLVLDLVTMRKFYDVVASPSLLVSPEIGDSARLIVDMKLPEDPDKDPASTSNQDPEVLPSPEKTPKNPSSGIEIEISNFAELI